MIGLELIDQNGVQVRSGWIRTKNPVTGYTGYIDSGTPSYSMEIPVGTVARYREYKYNGDYLARIDEVVTHIVHTITVPAGILSEHPLTATITKDV